jgi:hypothetical protein
MGVNVSDEQDDLEEKHAGNPDRSGPAEPGQEYLRDYRLHLEQQEGAQEYGQNID